MIAGNLALVAIGAIATLIATIAAYRVGRFVTNLEGLQQRVTIREMADARRIDRRQIRAIERRLVRLIADPRLDRETRVELEKLRELTAARDRESL